MIVTSNFHVLYFSNVWTVKSHTSQVSLWIRTWLNSVVLYDCTYLGVRFFQLFENQLENFECITKTDVKLSCTFTLFKSEIVLPDIRAKMLNWKCESLDGIYSYVLRNTWKITGSPIRTFCGLNSLNAGTTARSSYVKHIKINFLF